MRINRRDFVKISAATATAASATAGTLGAGMMARPGPEWVKSVCRFCGTGCGVQLAISDRKLVALRGDVDHPTTRGLVCAKALYLPKIVHSPTRLTHPMIRRGGKLERASWEEAMSLVAEKFADAIADHGPDSVAYYGSGQALSEESYFANRLFKGGIGTNNVEGNPRLCMASAVGGYVSTYGKDEPMGSYDDIDHANVFFLIGSNAAECHPVIFDRIMARKQESNRVMVICVDPRKSPVQSIADVYLSPKPGYDLALLHGMASAIIETNRHDEEFLAEHVQFKKVVDGKPVSVGWEAYREFLDDWTPEKAEAVCGVSAQGIRDAARAFAMGPTMSFWTMGLNQRTRGVWANNLVHNLHLLTGQIGKPGATPFSLTGQPNACGGVRDTGSLCHILPYGRVVKNPAHRAEMEALWGSEEGRIKPAPGLHTVAMFNALGQGDIKAMFVLTTNPAHSMPNLNAHRRAMANAPFLCVIDAFETQTTRLADVVLPAAMWTEKAGVFGMSERRYQYQPCVVDPPGQARPDLDVLIDLAKRLEARGVVPEGFVTGKLEDADAIWDEMREASRDTAYDFRGMTRERLKRERGVRWPAPTVDHPGTARRFVKGDDPLLDAGPYADESLAEGQLKFYAASDHRAVIWLRPVVGPAEEADEEYPFLLSTGRVLEHWHTGTMTMAARELRRAQPKAFVEIHPEDARALEVSTGDLVHLESRRGEASIEARVVDMPQKGTAFVPFHWEHAGSLINDVTIDAFDAGSKQPEFKICAVRLSKARTV
ncbi:MAG: nitrate reductase [Planctomycetota bacterium]|jgi:nitrate reductase NapA|nr:nitrate reductase [Planctomycetota bacterium]MDP6763612.1 nitrate reductase [Planctomycetota bacterium]MDP6989719.1 nitrate reductase [Planctomycetota bacterium]